jgi:GNAT superfamily N-acetyltransferase
VRPATPEDADAIADVHIRSWQEAYTHVFPAEELAGLTETRGERAERWRSTTQEPRPRSHALVAEKEGTVAGFAYAAPSRDEGGDCGELYMIYVAPEEWGCGAGQALMGEVLGRLREDGFPEAILWVLADNPRTRRFYELSGWEFDGGTKDEEWLGTLVREVRYRIALRRSSS